MHMMTRRCASCSDPDTTERKLDQRKTAVQQTEEVEEPERLENYPVSSAHIARHHQHDEKSAEKKKPDELKTNDRSVSQDEAFSSYPGQPATPHEGGDAIDQ